MADEIIRYEFTGDSSGVVNAAQQAMDALSRVDNAQNQLASSNPFAVLGQTLNNISSQYLP